MVKAVWWMERYQETRKCRDPRRSPATLLQMSDVTTDTETNGLNPWPRYKHHLTGAVLERESCRSP